MKFAYAQFPAASTKGADLFPIFRTALCRLTCLGICVVAVTCDGASDNRRMFCLHNLKDKMVYKTRNVYSKKGDTIFLSLIHRISSKQLEIAFKEANYG